MFDNIPSTENFPNLYPHRAVNLANTVYGYHYLSIGNGMEWAFEHVYGKGAISNDNIFIIFINYLLLQSTIPMYNVSNMYSPT